MKMKMKKTITLLLVLTLLMSTISFAQVDYTDLGKGVINATTDTKIFLNEEINVNEIEHIALVDLKTRKNMNASFEFFENESQLEVIIRPIKNLQANTDYELKIYTSGDQYKHLLTVSKYVNFKEFPQSMKYYEKTDTSGDVTWEEKYVYRVEVPANPSKGFNFPYFLNVPVKNTLNEDGWIIPTDEFEITDYSNYLLVEPNNTGALTSKDYTEVVLESDIYSGNFADRMAAELGMPHLMPAFPRPSFDDYYTHLLDEDSLFMTQEESDTLNLGDLTRIDKQLKAMIEDAKEQFNANGISLEEKVVLAGFSASSKFVNRYSMIYPETVEAVIAGTILTAPMLPFSESNGNKLNYPLGINDYESRFGKVFNNETYKQIKQFWFVGENDTNDVVSYRNAFTEKEATIIHSVLGKEMKNRWKEVGNVYTKYGANIITHVYKNIAHGISSITERDGINFLKKNLGKEFTPIVPNVSGK